MPKHKPAPPVEYRYRPNGEGATQGARPETHYAGFTRTPIPSQIDPAAADNALDSGSFASSSAVATGGSQAPAEETFEIGDAVYLPSSYAAPLVGVLTQLWTLDGRVSQEQDTIYGVVRLLHWPEWMSTMAKRRMAGLTSKNEIYYTHKAPKVSKRRTQTAIKTGQQGDDFEAGPALHDYSFDVKEIIAKVHIHPSQSECLEAVRHITADVIAAEAASEVRASASSSRRAKSHPARHPKVHCAYKGKLFPLQLFCERAVDPNRELFWKVDWSKINKRGKEDRRWDLIDESSEELKALTDEGQRVNDVAEEMAAAKEVHDSKVGVDEGAPATPNRRSRLAVQAEDTAEQAPTMGRSMRAASSLRTPSKTFSIASDDFSDREDDDVDSGSDDSFRGLSDDDDDDDEDLITSAATFNPAGDGSDDDLMQTPSRKRSRSSQLNPMTPSKRRVLSTPQKMAEALNSPAKAMATPRSRARLVGAKARSLPHPALPARPAKISSLSGEEIRKLSPQERAKRLLHVGATPEHLPCREDQFEEIMACVEDAVEEGIGGCVYVSGVPGTGKTATVREVIRNLTARAERNEMNPFSFVEINGMKVADASQAYTLLWSAVSGGQKAAPKTALNLLSSHFARVGAANSVGAGAGGAGVGAGPGRAATVVLMDELDQLVTARQDVMYNMFNWPNTRGSRLVVIAVANTMDLPERTLNPKVASRLGMTRIVFMPYTDRQLVEIVKSRLGIPSTWTGMGPGGAGTIAMAAKYRQEETDSTRGCKDVFHLDAITYVSKRVSNVSGDARRMLDVCRRAIELVEMKALTAAAGGGTDSAINGESTPTATTPGAPARGPVKAVTIADMKAVLDSMVKSGRVSHILSLPLHGKILLLSLFSCLRRSGLVEAELGDVLTHHKAVCRMYSIYPSPSFSFPPAGGAGASTGKQGWDKVDFSLPISQLCSLGLVVAVGNGAGSGRAAGFSRLLLACQEDEVRLAFGNDADDRLRRML